MACVIEVEGIDVHIIAYAQAHIDFHDIKRSILCESAHAINTFPKGECVVFSVLGMGDIYRFLSWRLCLLFRRLRLASLTGCGAGPGGVE